MSTLSNLSLCLYRVIWTGLDWLYPPVCVSCGAFGLRWCKSCQAKVEKVPYPVCIRCGCGNQPTGLCGDCKQRDLHYDGLRSWALFGGSVRQALHQLKYHRDITLGIIFLPHLERTLHRENWAIDLIVPVPLSRQRARQRGYNQSTFLAFPLALSMAIPFRPAALSRVRETTAQVGLSSHQRLKNVENAFAADEALVSNKIVLVVDDVTTTGATINACANALKKAGATKVYGLTLARSNWPDQAG